MRSFTDIFIKHPVLAVVVNLVILLAGWRALTALPLQQYPKIESSSVIITTVYYGASAETVRGFSQHADRAGRLRDRRGRRCGVDQSRRRQHRYGALEAEPQQHGGSGRGHRAAPTGTIRAAGGSRTACDRSATRRSPLRVLLSQLCLYGTQRAGRHGLVVAHAAASTLDVARCPTGYLRGRPPGCHANLDDPNGWLRLNLSPGDMQAPAQQLSWRPSVERKATWCRSTCWRIPTCAPPWSSKT